MFRELTPVVAVFAFLLAGCQRCESVPIQPEKPWEPRANALFVGYRKVCLRVREGEFECVGEGPAKLTGTEQLQPGYRQDLAGRWHGSAPSFDSIYGLVKDDGEREQVRLQNASQIQIGSWSSCVVRGGKVYCWGFNEMRQLGGRPQGDECYFMKSTVSCSKEPVEVPGLSGVVEVLGEEGRCARLGDGSVWCWGDFHAERSESGARVVSCQTNADCETMSPRRIEPLPKIVQMTKDSAFLGVDEEGSVHVWGHQTTQADQFRAERLTGLGGVKKLCGADLRHGCALLKDGRVKCWVPNERLSRDAWVERENTRVFTLVEGIDAAVDVAMSDRLACALRRDRTVWCWGRLDPILSEPLDGGSSTVPRRVLPRLHAGTMGGQAGWPAE